MLKVNMLRSKLALQGMSQHQLADRLGVSKNTLSSRMNGKSSFTLEEVERICEILEIHNPTEQKQIFLS